VSETRIRVVIADDLKLQREMMKAALGQSERFLLVGEATTGAELVEIAKRESPDVVLTDLHMPVLDGAQALRILSFAIPSCVFIVFSGEDDIEKLRPVISAGASDFLKKPLQMNKLLDAIEAIYEREAPRKLAAHAHQTAPTRSSKVVSFVAAQAGCGSSLVAANTAAGLVRAYGKQVALVDFDFQSAGVTRYLGLQDGRSILDLFQELDQVTLEGVQGYMETVHGVAVLPGPPFPLDAARRDPGILTAILDVLAAEYDVVVVDLEPRMDEANTFLIGKSDRTFLTVSNDPSSLQPTARWMAVYKHSNPPAEKLHLIYCHSRPEAVIPGGQVAGTVGIGIFGDVAHDYANARASLRDAKPAIFDQNTTLGKALGNLVQKIGEKQLELGG